MNNVFRAVCLTSMIALGIGGFTGCGSDEAASVVDSEDLDAIQEYERMIAEEEKAAQEGMEASQ
ncbi:hypothetical protein LOC71_03370 [Rhodopirellula sp. JC740]|uniref:Secreted protein n=1 Tax=Rhodopirellula halodulae TaxID=2894198 RepID=A0ABS8NCL0_9BACT|nr:MULTISPECIES: hypothetical protein [unclassified Rhodopirellula]MCC9641300.1 hypothetical protein [Rhodopirellula sp. JC740]MCC9657709.1 hypothetical protein [Rhodopirellula sp. JC737]